MIAIYGDSYGIDYDKGWVNLLCDKLGEEQLNKCEGGSSTDFAYSNFLQTNHLADKVIFIVSSYTRGSIFTLKNNRPEHLAFYQNTSLAELDIQNKSASGKSIDKKLGKIIQNEIYKTKIYDSNVMYHKAYIDSVKYHRPDAHVIFAFPFPGVCPVGIINISKLDWNKLSLQEDNDFRMCHMSNTQNKEFANYMVQHINNEIDIHHTMTNPSKYYTTSKTLEEANWV
jgi:hypothetical protein